MITRLRGVLDRCGNRCLSRPTGNIPPAEFEVLYNQGQRVTAEVVGLKCPLPRGRRGGSTPRRSTSEKSLE